MQELPVDKIKKQFEVLSSSDNSFFIKECISPEINGRMITLKNDVRQNMNERSLKSQKYFNYCKQYVAFFKSRSFQFLFNDYSLGRFMYEFDDNNCLISYNLYWNPCPWCLEYMEELENAGYDIAEYIDCIEEKEKIELNQIVLRTPIRLDYVREYDGRNPQFHPQFHMHYQDKNTRAFSQNIMSLYSYMLFILENCYPGIYCEKKYEEKIETLRKLEKEAAQSFKLGRGGSKDDNLGEKIHTMICRRISRTERVCF